MLRILWHPKAAGFSNIFIQSHNDFRMLGILVAVFGELLQLSDLLVQAGNVLQ